MTEPLDPPDEIDDSPRDEEIAALREDVKALRRLLRRAKPFLEFHSHTLRREFRPGEYRVTSALIAEIEKELEN